MNKGFDISKLALVLLLFSMFNLHAGTYGRTNCVISIQSYSNGLEHFLKSNAHASFVTLFQTDAENDFIDNIDVELELDQINYSDNVNHFEFALDTEKSFTRSITLPNKSKIPLYILFCNWKYDMN